MKKTNPNEGIIQTVPCNYVKSGDLRETFDRCTVCGDTSYGAGRMACARALAHLEKAGVSLLGPTQVVEMMKLYLADKRREGMTEIDSDLIQTAFEDAARLGYLSPRPVKAIDEVGQSLVQKLENMRDSAQLAEWSEVVSSVSNHFSAAGLRAEGAVLVAVLEEMCADGYTAEWTHIIATVSNHLSGRRNLGQRYALPQQADPDRD